MAFDCFRENGQPTFYSAVHTAWQADLVVCGLIFWFCISAASFYIILFGLAGKEKFYSFTRVTVSLFIGAVILTTNFAMTWESAETSTQTKYKAGTGVEVNVTVGVYIGFRGVNITLKGEKDQIQGETINYNEHFSWEGLQGRLGFGPLAGQFNQDYRAAQFRGLPLPILWVAEYFTLDGEGIRWGRFYRQAGWYAHIMLWLAFPLWILANVLFFVLLRYGAYMLCLTGASMLIANLIWATYRNVLELEIPFTEFDILEFSFGASFWLCLGTGLMCVLLGIIVFFLDKLSPTFIAKFFGVDVLQDSEQIQVEDDVNMPTIVDAREDLSPIVEDDGMGGTTPIPEPNSQGSAEDIYSQATMGSLDPPESLKSRQMDSFRMPIYTKKSFRTFEHRLTKRLQRPRRKEVQPYSDSDVYVNASPSKSINLEMKPSSSRYVYSHSLEEENTDDSLYSN